MARIIIKYPESCLLIGPAPYSGYNFIDISGNLNDTHTSLINNHNLLFPLYRVQSVNYDISTNRTDIVHLGNRGTISTPNLNPPTISLSFDYFQQGLLNDLRIGLDCNYAQYQTGLSGLSYHENNYSVNVLSGLMSRQLTKPVSEPFWPLSCRDARNIYLITSQEGKDVIENYLSPSGADLTQGIDPDTTGYKILSFGNCYLNSYRTEGSVGAIPRSSTNWTCYNANFILSGSGILTPSVNTQTRQNLNNQRIVVPEISNEGGPVILHPGDVLLSFISSGNGLISGLEARLDSRFENHQIQNYSIEFNLNRGPLNSLGYKLPLDQQINFPVFVEADFGILLNEMESGSFIDQLNIDSGYNIKLQLRNVLECSRFRATPGRLKHSGPTKEEGQTAIMYDFWNAKYIGSDTSLSIGNNKMTTLKFRTEIDPENFNKQGFYISGLMNIERLEDYLLDEEFVPIEDGVGQLLVANVRPLY